MSMRRPDARALVRKRAASARAREDANGSSPHAASPTRTGRGDGGDETARSTVQRLEADKSALIYDLQVAQQQISSLTEANRYLERMVRQRAVRCCCCNVCKSLMLWCLRCCGQNSSSGMTSSLRGQLSEARRKLVRVVTLRVHALGGVLSPRVPACRNTRSKALTSSGAAATKQSPSCAANSRRSRWSGRLRW